MSETPEQRSHTMRAVRSRDTGPEMIVRRFLHAAGLRYRLHDRRLPGVPDLVFPSRRVALFVHGCFWHQHPGCEAAARPKSRPDYWNRKLDGNVARDARHLAEVATGWFCHLRATTAEGSTPWLGPSGSALEAAHLLHATHEEAVEHEQWAAFFAAVREMR